MSLCTRTGPSIRPQKFAPYSILYSNSQLCLVIIPKHAVQTVHFTSFGGGSTSEVAFSLFFFEAGLYKVSDHDITDQSSGGSVVAPMHCPESLGLLCALQPTTYHSWQRSTRRPSVLQTHSVARKTNTY